MNEERRSKLRDAVGFLDRASAIVDTVYDKEQDCLDNMPENLQNTERYEHMEDAVDHLNDALERLDEVKEHIQSAISK